MTVRSKREKWIQVVVYKQDAKQAGTMTSSGTNRRLAPLPSWLKG